MDQIFRWATRNTGPILIAAGIAGTFNAAVKIDNDPCFQNAMKKDKGCTAAEARKLNDLHRALAESYLVFGTGGTIFLLGFAFRRSGKAKPEESFTKNAKAMAGNKPSP
jgi:hypothetical protein